MLTLQARRSKQRPCLERADSACAELAPDAIQCCWMGSTEYLPEVCPPGLQQAASASSATKVEVRLEHDAETQSL